MVCKQDQQQSPDWGLPWAFIPSRRNEFDSPVVSRKVTLETGSYNVTVLDEDELGPNDPRSEDDIDGSIDMVGGIFHNPWSPAEDPREISGEFTMGENKKVTLTINDVPPTPETTFVAPRRVLKVAIITRRLFNFLRSDDPETYPVHIGFTDMELCVEEFPHQVTSRTDSASQTDQLTQEDTPDSREVVRRNRR